MKKFSFVAQLICSTIAFALEGGPTQPDYLQFEPTEMKDMVNLISGNFAYSIPLGEVPGAYGSYPLSLSYHAGISPQQEATWVGLGWTLSPGSIVRDVRGVPDDQFHGGTLGFIYQYSAMYTWNIDVSFSLQEFSVGFTASSTNGIGAFATIGPNIDPIVHFGFTASMNQGGGLGVGFDGGLLDKDGVFLAKGLGLNASAMFYPKSMDFSVHAGVSSKRGNLSGSLGVQYATGQAVSASVGMSMASKSGLQGVKIFGSSIRKNGTSASLGEVGATVANSITKGGTKSSSAGFSFVIPTFFGSISLGYTQTLHEYHMRSATSDYVYGYMYQGGPAILADGDNNIDEIPDAQTGSGPGVGRIPWNWTLKGRTIETLGDDKMHPAYDMFTIESEGVSGTFRAYPREEHQLFKLTSNMATVEANMVESYNPILELDDKHWPHSEEFVYKYDDTTKTERENTEYPSYMVNDSVNSVYAKYKTRFRNEGNRMVYRIDKKSDEPLTSGLNFLFLGEGGYYESEGFAKAKGREPGSVSDILLKKTIDDKQYALYGSRKVEPIFEDESPISKIKGFVITNSDGSKYFFTQPVKTYLKADYTINQEKGIPVFIDYEMSKWKTFFDNIWGDLWSGVKKMGKEFGLKNGKGIFSGKLEESCKKEPSEHSYIYSYLVNINPYATQWLLKEIQGPDYVQLDKDDDDIKKTIGYNVRFHYTKPSLYQWRTPYAKPNAKATELPNFRMPRNGLAPIGCDTKMYQASFGVKEYIYLTKIETSTHEVKFELNDPEREERVDGKGWYFEKNEETNNGKEETLPIFTTAAISLRIKSVTNETHTISFDKYDLADNEGKPLKWNDVGYDYEYLYVNTEIPELLINKLKKNPKLFLISDYYNNIIFIDDKTALHFPYNFFEINVDTAASNIIEKITGEDAQFGLYRIKLKPQTDDIIHGRFVPNSETCEAFLAGKARLILAENGIYQNLGKKEDKYSLNRSLVEFHALPESADWFKKFYIIGKNRNSLISPLLDWSDIVFASNLSDATTNQMRYLKKISYYNKKDKNPYREYNFEYDYSLHPGTLNSYCKYRYPQELADLKNSPKKASLDVCSTDTSSNVLYGKLTLKSVTEKACQNGRCASLPAFKFDYNAADQTSTRYSTKKEWEELSRQNVPKVITEYDTLMREEFHSIDFYNKMTDIDASILASENTTDEWGFWNNVANEENRKVNQSFADYGGAAWSLNKITDPAGGVMEVKYERDVYKNGEDHSEEHMYVPILRAGRCSDFMKIYPGAYTSYDSKYDAKTCLMFLPMYWKDQCLGPRAAYWSYIAPKGYTGGNFEYMNAMGITENKVVDNIEKTELNKDTTVFFNFQSVLKTQIACGLTDCGRSRNVGLLTSGKFLDMYEGIVVFPTELLPSDLQYAASITTPTRVLVLDKESEMVYAGLQIAADKVSADQAWINVFINGAMWIKRDYASMKGGDIRVKSLVRYDIDRVAKTEYEYDPGEMAQLPDSAYTTVMGNRFNVNIQNFAMPDINTKPKSRIVGFEDDDLLYVPGSRIMYPKVTVKNSDNKENITNGKTEFDFITPEKGVPKEYIDSVTKTLLTPFIHVNAYLMAWGGDKNDLHYKTRPIVITFEFLDKDNNRIAAKEEHLNPANVLLMQNRFVSFNFYSDEVKNVRKIKATFKYTKGNENCVQEGNDCVQDVGIVDVDGMTDFNEVTITVSHILSLWQIHKNWQRSQETGYYPILYKQIAYTTDREANILMAKEAKDVIQAQKIKPILEDTIVYHDFTAFLGMNTKTSIYRGNGEKGMLLKVDSNVYTTRVPDILEGVAEGNSDTIATKIGKQVERWKSKRELQCVNEFAGGCLSSDVSLSVFDSSMFVVVYPQNKKEYNLVYFQDSILFEYRRYPVFQKASISANGFDNQEKQFYDNSSSSMTTESSSDDARAERNEKRRHWSILENHKYDPLTSNPTATLAKAPAIDGKEMRKLTVKLPHHAVSKASSPTDLAKHMFKKNMLNQNFAEYVYFDSLPVEKNALWNNLENVQYLRSFNMSPMKRFSNEIKDSSGKIISINNESRPYVEWGTFTSRKEPKQILQGADQYSFVADYQSLDAGDSLIRWPNKDEFDGNHILRINSHFMPIETEDVFGRVASAHYSDDGIHQTGLFFPASLNKTASIVLDGDEITEVNLKQSTKNKLEASPSKKGMIVQSSMHLTCSVFDCDSNLVAEYRVKKKGESWFTERINVKDLKLNLSKGDILNYLRIYPKKAQAKTFIYDRYANIVQIVGEDNTSTYYEYDPFGKLIQTRNDDGVGFKSHHREFMNDDRNEIPWNEIVISSSSSDI